MLAVLQFWVIALAIPLLVARAQVKGYQAWRAEQRRLDQQRRRALGEVRCKAGDGDAMCMSLHWHGLLL